ncbi:hypothetical protein F8M41_000605 [Gigaspora margarita]|uniref:BED-type domain-containing protein n=1 Tax=Gigaspora margarita TaxID=4874 RepID=A0A8H3XHP7_GIGMA|nr:hypothetical protein F8M41_000605 [Gigaspora margarita]
MSLDDQYQLNSYNNDIIALSNESNVSDISKNPNDPNIESNSSSSEQSTLQNNGVTVITNSLDGNENTCNQEYKLLTGIGNLKSHLCQIHRILPPKTNNNNNQLINIASNQSSLHNFLNKKTSLPSSKYDKITN